MEESFLYPFAEPPAEGCLQEVGPGVFWLRMPLPFPPGHINLYCLAEPDGGWTVFDCGVHDDASKELWSRIERDGLGGRRISRLLVSHWHADHAGLAGWLGQRHGARLLMAASEYLQCRGLDRAPDAETVAAAAAFHRRQGLAGSGLDGIVDNMAHGRRRHGPMPAEFDGLVHDQDLILGGRQWRVFLCGGHALDLVAAWCPSANILFTSDQVLPQISAHVGVMVMDPHADVMGRFLHSLEVMRDAVPEDVLVLPSHNLPFVGLHQRIDQLAAHHERRCQTLMVACADAPRCCADLLPLLFRRQLDAGFLSLALRETQAHVNHLLAQGRLAPVEGQDGIMRYRAI